MEIKATDLRIGNCIQKLVIDEWVYDTVQARDMLLIYNHPELVKGIPLTEELLLKMGIELNPDAETDAFEKYRHKTIKDFTLEMFNNEGWVINGLDQWLTPEPFKYLHQLQNKFYFSTDIELTLS